MDKNKKEQLYAEFEKELHNQLINSLEKESDRAKLVLVVSWIDHFLNVKLQNEFSKGNKKARKDLFSSNGPFAAFSSKLNLAFCAGWIDSDVYHDIQIIKKLRNDCAHSIDSISLNEEKIRKEIEKFKVPRRKFFDWGEPNIWVVSKENKIILTSGEKPDEATGKLKMFFSGAMTLTIALPVIFTVLISNLKIYFLTEDGNQNISFIIGLPDYMKKDE